MPPLSFSFSMKSRRIGQTRQRAVGDRPVNARQVLHDDPASAEIGVPDLGIAHLAVGQPDIMLAGVETGMRPAPRQRVPDRRGGAFDSVVAPSSRSPQPSRMHSTSGRGRRVIDRSLDWSNPASTLLPQLRQFNRSPAVSHITAGIERREANRSPFRRCGNGGGNQTIWLRSSVSPRQSRSRFSRRISMTLSS